MQNSQSKVLFSIVVPVYFNALNIPHLFPRLKNLQSLVPQAQFEYIFVDDGSKDESLEVLQKIKSQNQSENIIIVKLSRNFGSFNAISAGLMEAKGDCVGIIAADLQDPPELFKDMFVYWQKGKKVVMGCRKTRQDTFMSKLLASLFYKALRLFALPQMPEGGFDFVLIDRKVVDVVNKIQEKNGSTMALIAWLGFDNERIYYDRLAREHGKSMWTWSKKFKLFVDVFVSYTYAPIRAITYLGFFFGLVSIGYAMFILFTKVSRGIEVPGYSSLAIMMLILFGFTLISLGIIGEYLFRTLDEVRKRPNFVIDQIY